MLPAQYNDETVHTPVDAVSEASYVHKWEFETNV